MLTEIKKNLVFLLIIVLFGGLAVSYLTSPKPILFSESKCDSYIGGKTEEYEFIMQNREENTGLVSVCFNSNTADFESKEDLVSKFCFSETEVHPKSSELVQRFTSTMITNIDEIDEGDNLTINISVDCSQEIWTFLRRGCNNLFFECVYEKRHNSFKLLT